MRPSVNCRYEVAAAALAVAAEGADAPMTSNCSRTEGWSATAAGSSAPSAGTPASFSESSPVVSPTSRTVVSPYASSTTPTGVESISCEVIAEAGRSRSSSAAASVPAGRPRRRPK